MKIILLFILSFVLLSALPFFWNQFSFVEAGFPFPYLQKITIENPEMSSTIVTYSGLNLLYDLVLTGIFVWALYQFKMINNSAKP